MTSKDTNTSQGALISLIYRHLRDNGHQKAANVLRKHAPQVETEEVKTSLSKIFKKWASEKKRPEKAGRHRTGHKESLENSDNEVPHLPSDIQTPDLSPARSKKISSAAKSSKKQSTAGVRAPSAVCSKKKTVDTNIRKTSGSKKSRGRKCEEGSGGPAAVCVSAGTDSDSDSSLDVEKWTKLVSQLSDADLAKMEVLSNLVESPVSATGKSTEKRKRTRQPKPKKETNAAKNGKSRTPVSKARATTSKTSSKKPKAHAAAADLQANGGVLMNTEAAGLSDCENISTDQAVTAESPDSLSEQLKTPGKAKKSLTSQTRSSGETPSKKGKRKKAEKQCVQTPSTKAKKDKITSKPADAHCDDATLKAAAALLTSDQSETPAKKAHNKKSRSVVKPVPSDTPKKLKAKKTEDLADPDKSVTSNKADVLQESSDSLNKRNKLNEGKSPSDADETTKKSKKAKNVIAEPAQFKTPCKTPETDSSDVNLLLSNHTKGSSKKRKNKSSSNSLETERDGLSETQITKSSIKSRKSQAVTGNDDDDGSDGLSHEVTSSQDLKAPCKKRKHKSEEANYDLAQEEATPEPKKAKKEKNKNKDEENVEDLQQPAEEALVAIAISQKKKKRRKDTEAEEAVTDDLPVADEDTVHKKKKKSREKHLSCGDAPGLQHTAQ